MTQQEMFGRAVWLGAADCKNTDAFVLRGRFCASAVKRATLRVLGLGFFYCYLNGKRVGDEQFLPLSTEYEPRPNFPTGQRLTAFRTYVPEYDVTSLLREGENEIVIHFGGGWYTFEQYPRRQQQKFGDPKAIWRVFGESDVGAFDFGSSTADQIAESFVCDYRFDRFEVQDYTRATPEALFEFSADTVWKNAVLATAPDTTYHFSDCPADRVVEILPVKCVGEGAYGRVYDCGRNTTGSPVLRLLAKSGETVQVTLSEELTAEGEIDLKFSHKQTFTCVCDGTQREVRALFTWYGFRYFAVAGNAEVLGVEVVHTDVERISDFCSDNETLNWLHEAFLNTQLANMHAGIPSDCPHIERRGYTGDGQLACLATMKMLDTERFYRKWMQDIADSQDSISGQIQNTAPYTHSGGGLGGWGSGIVEIPWQFYQHFGDKEPLEKYYPNMLRYFDYVESHSERDLVISDKAGEWCLGDWCCPTSVVLPAPFVNTYFYIKSLSRAIDIARIIGKEGDIPRFEARIAACKHAISCAYLNTWDGNFFGSVQGANAFAVDLGLGDGRTWQKLLDYYTSLGEFDTGIFGTELLIRLLFERGEGDLAVRLLTSDKIHTFTEMKRRGATTIFEHWPDSYRDRSHSHPMFGAVVSHLYTYLLGIRQLQSEGGESLVIAPVSVESINRVCGYRTLQTGRVFVELCKKEGKLHAEITLPEGQNAHFLWKGEQTPLHPGKNTLCVDV